MKFSESWLREFVNPTLSTQALVDQLTMAGLEIDGFEPVAAQFSGVVVGEIISAEQHPDADKLKLCSVSNGSETFQIVCGAPNARAGIKVPFAMIGAKLEDFKIKKAKLRGVESFGMLCSETELGISDNNEGLMELSLDAETGQDVREYLELDDHIIDLDLTPNRSDCLSMIGLAREAGLLNSLDVKTISVPAVVASTDAVFPVELKASAACPRFAGRIIRNINLKAPTPLWMVEKLRRSDIRSIDAIVDITNYVMLELGQPMHAYDFEKLSGKIKVRQSVAGEKLTLLDSQEVTLNADTLLITDDSGPIGMAGIMGGLSTSVSDTTKDIYLESAFFEPTAIAGRARSYGLNTDAAHRFERGVDWQQQSRAIERATQLILSIAGGEAGITTETVAESELPTSNSVTLRLERVSRLLGVEIEATRISEMLDRLGFAYEQEADTWVVTAPSYRFDIAIEADLIEEVSRIYGYNNLPVRTPKANLVMTPVDETLLPERQFKRQLIARGYQEAITYTFVDPKIQAILDPDEEPVALANPLSSEMAVMRTTLWSGLIKVAMHNLNRQQSRIRLFETGLRFQTLAGSKVETVDQLKQDKMLAGIVLGPRQNESWNEQTEATDFYDVKGDVEALLGLSNVTYRFVIGEHAALHPGQTAKIMKGDEVVGFIGLMDPRAQKQLGLDQNVFLFELKLSAISEKSIPVATPLSKYPEVRRDIAVIVDEVVSSDVVINEIKLAAGESFQNLKLFDVYRGKGIDPNRKSLALGLTFQHPSRTLTDEEINQSIDDVVAVLATKFLAELRN